MLFQLEDELIELLLQRLIRVVNTELLEGIALEGLEAEYIQDADTRPSLGDYIDGSGCVQRLAATKTRCPPPRPPGPEVDAGVDPLGDEIKRRAVYRLYERLARLRGLSRVQPLLDHVPPGENDLGR